MSFELGYGAGERLEDNYIISPPVVVLYLVCELPLRPFVESYYLSLMGCEGVARVDLRLGDDGVPYFLEVNTIPGMTETSLVPMGAAARGMSFSRLVDRIALYALKKADLKSPESGG